VSAENIKSGRGKPLPMRFTGLHAVAFISGACAMAVEIAGSRAMAAYVGSTIYTWAAGIAFTLVSLSIGYMAGGIIADRSKDAKGLGAALLCAGIGTAAIPLILRNLMLLFAGSDVVTASLAAGLALVPACVFYGMTSPFVIRFVSSMGNEGGSAGGVYAISTAGSVVGILSTGFVLVPNMGLGSIFLLLGAAMAAVACAQAIGGARP
jgi:predicted membrane-bound spermidine synthase